ncbi:MAG TPA: HPr(Ser) kinase/phosphatase [Longimicrobiales bacterium]|nr:HPr(Ser) kinase/phosphatase [Longimicrobiales bacterium]
MTKLSVEELFRTKERALELELLTPNCTLGREIESSTLSSPGLVLAGFRDRFLRGRLQVLGETEIRWLDSLDEARLRDTLDSFLNLEMPALFVTKSLAPPPALLELAVRHDIPVLRSSLKTGDFYRRLQPYLEERFAPHTTEHGSLADVYGVGVMFIGRSGIGKSECVLDLVERGHRLVADDLVMITKRGNDVLIGRGHEHQQHHMEIRGVGIVDIKMLFGIRSIRQQKRVEVVVRLVDWDDKAQYDRTGLETEEVEILGVRLPRITIPLNAGKNITVISEVVAMNHLLKYSGVHSARMFNQRLMDSMQPVRAYLEEDYE